MEALTRTWLSSAAIAVVAHHSTQAKRTRSAQVRSLREDASLPACQPSGIQITTVLASFATGKAAMGGAPMRFTPGEAWRQAWSPPLSNHGGANGALCVGAGCRAARDRGGGSKPRPPRAGIDDAQQYLHSGAYKSSAPPTHTNKGGSTTCLAISGGGGLIS